MSLKPVLECLEEIANVSSHKQKEKLIQHYLDVEVPCFQKVVYYALNPFLKFNTTQVNYLPEENKCSLNSIFWWLDELSKQRGAKDVQIEDLSKSSSYDKETVEVVNRIVNKDLKCGASLKTFRKFIPEIPEYEVMRAESDLDAFFRIHNYDLSKYYYSIKFDGVRTQTNGSGIYLSRNGKEYPNFDVFNDEINELIRTLNFDETEVVLDGEVIYEGADQHEFQNIMTQIRRLKNVDPSNFKFYIFDIVIDKPFHERYDLLKYAFNKISNERIGLVDHERCDDFNSLDELKEYSRKIIDEGYEGLVLKDAEATYEKKKSKHWCKVKRIYDAEAKVIGWNYGKGKYKNLIGALKCCFSDGTTFNISGLTDAQREEFMYNTPSIIEMEHQGFTKDGKPRHPEFKRVREDKNEID